MGRRARAKFLRSPDNLLLGAFWQGRVCGFLTAHRRVLSVRLGEETYRRWHDAAVKKGIGPSTLVRMWVLDAPDKAGNEGSRATAD